jgi:hypothetical protein
MCGTSVKSDHHPRFDNIAEASENLSAENKTR